MLRTYTHPPGEGWKWKEDYVYAGSRLIATVSDTGTFHTHTDHLGSVRQVTDESGAQVSQHAFYPFGEEATAPTQSDLPLKYTGHERDANTTSGTGTGRGALDYMHARFCRKRLRPQEEKFISSLKNSVMLSKPPLEETRSPNSNRLSGELPE